jgi:hypothetical protein
VFDIEVDETEAKLLFAAAARQAQPT